MSPRKVLIAAAHEYCRRHAISMAALGEMILRDNKFFARVGRGGGFNISTYERIMAALQNPPPRPKGRGK